MKAKHSKGKRYRAKGRTASRAVNAARRLKIIPIITRDMNRMADWLNATGVVQVAIIEAVQYYIDEKQSMDVDRIKAVQGFKLTDKVNDIVQAHVKAQQAVQPITEPHDTSGEPYDPTSPANIAAHEKAKREKTGAYAKRAVIPTDLSHVGAELEQKYKDENATDPPST